MTHRPGSVLHRNALLPGLTHRCRDESFGIASSPMDRRKGPRFPPQRAKTGRVRDPLASESPDADTGSSPVSWKLTHAQSGFSLVELMVVMAILVIVIGVATDGLIQLQKRSRADASKLDMTQEARQFMDQIINDIHQVGYPNTKIFDPAGAPSQNNISAGLVSVTSTSMQFEADVDGTGTVSEVYLQLVVPAAGCPCTLQRGTIPKAQVGTGAVPYYTEVNNVTNTAIFDAYDFAGNLVALPASATDLPNIKTIRITVNVQQNSADINGVRPTVTMVSEAKINN